MKKHLLTLIYLMACSFVTTAQTLPSYVSPIGLAGWWPFNGNAIDESINSNDGIVTGAVLSNDRVGNLNSSYLWNTSPDKIMVPNNALLQLSDSFTISCWINPLNGVYGSGPNYHAIIEKWGSTGDASYIVGLRLNGIPFMDTHNGITTTVLDGLQPVSFNTWTHIVYVQKNDSAFLYINGILNASRDGMLIPMTMNNHLFFGANDPYNTGNYLDSFEGNIDDIGIWNRSLNTQQIIALYQATSVGVIESEMTESTLSIFPNPVSDILHFNLTFTEHSPITISVFNTSGQRVLEVFNNNLDPGHHEQELPVNDLSNGIYFMRVEWNNTITTDKFIVAR